ncbi:MULTISPECIES: fluoride efflux transporter FluC [Bacillus]|uniref:fluoride efflux transporter FluC n=1 Tax=Bacillus TaxID=1386 RepID=UPI000BB68883|nr:MULTISPECIES: CrcB family protein [Bacillus]
MTKNLIAIFLGGAIGALLRYYINLGTITMTFPIGTVLENLIGSLLLGLLTGFLIKTTISEWLKVGLGVGVCGGFTTMSTLAGDANILLMNGSLDYVILYILTSVLGGILLAAIGVYFGLRIGIKALEKKKKVYGHG